MELVIGLANIFLKCLLPTACLGTENIAVINDSMQTGVIHDGVFTIKIEQLRTV